MSVTRTSLLPGSSTSVGVDEFTGSFTVCGLDASETAIVDLWVVLDSTVPAGVNGNVQSNIVGANVNAATDPMEDAISVGNQTVPLLKVQEFFSADADLTITKSDLSDPVVAGTTLSCDDDNTGTDDDCDPVEGCANDSIGCDDGNACTVDSCDEQGGCMHEDIDCNDGNACTIDTCDTSSGCANVVFDCDDGN